MHVAHFHPPRAVAVTLIAAVLTIVVTLAIASRVNDTSSGSAASAGQRQPVSRLVPTLPWAGHSAPTPASTPAWLTSPFSPLLGRPTLPGWSVGSGS